MKTLSQEYIIKDEHTGRMRMARATMDAASSLYKFMHHNNRNRFMIQ